MSKCSEAFTEGDFRSETKVTLQSGGIGIGGGNITGLHGYELLVSLEIIVLGEHTGTHQFLLEDIHEVEEVLGDDRGQRFLS